MNLCGSRQEGVDCADGFSFCRGQSDDSSPCVSNYLIDRKDSAFKTKRQFIFQPLLVTAPSTASCHALDSVAKLGQRDNAQKEGLLVGAIRPGSEPGVGPWLLPF